MGIIFIFMGILAPLGFTLRVGKIDRRRCRGCFVHFPSTHEMFKKASPTGMFLSIYARALPRGVVVSADIFACTLFGAPAGSRKCSSCDVCHQRKLKCDGAFPCFRCVKAGTVCRRHGQPVPGTRMQYGSACGSCRDAGRVCQGGFPCFRCQHNRTVCVPQPYTAPRVVSSTVVVPSLDAIVNCIDYTMSLGVLETVLGLDAPYVFSEFSKDELSGDELEEHDNAFQFFFTGTVSGWVYSCRDPPPRSCPNTIGFMHKPVAQTADNAYDVDGVIMHTYKEARPFVSPAPPTLGPFIMSESDYNFTKSMTKITKDTKRVFVLKV